MMRFRSNFQLPQMIAADGYPEFISLASQFTVSSFRAWPYASRDSSHFYLLSFWSRIAAANTYVRSGGPPSLLENFVPKVAEAYITSRLELVALILQNPTIEDPLDDEEQLEEQLEQLPQLGRCKFTETSAFLLTAFDPLAQAFEKFIAAGNASPQAQLVELQLTWLTYLIASILGGRLEAGASEEHDPVDGLLASRIFRLLILSDSRTTPRPSPAHEKLERAVLFFLQQFRRVFIGEQAMSSSKVYGRLAEDLGLGDHLHVLNFMINKIGTNLKRWGREPRIIEKTLCLFQDLASGYSSGKLLAQLEGINQLLTHHTSEYFPFLDLDENLRSRTVYYNTLAKLFLAMDDNAVRFRAFMEPFRTAFLAIGAQLHDPSVARQPLAQRRLIGLLRDLRGIADACVSRYACDESPALASDASPLGGVTRCSSTGCTRRSPRSSRRWRKSTLTSPPSPPRSSSSTPSWCTTSNVRARRSAVRSLLTRQAASTLTARLQTASSSSANCRASSVRTAAPLCSAPWAPIRTLRSTREYGASGVLCDAL